MLPCGPGSSAPPKHQCGRPCSPQTPAFRTSGPRPWPSRLDRASGQGAGGRPGHERAGCPWPPAHPDGASLSQHLVPLEGTQNSPSPQPGALVLVQPDSAIMSRHRCWAGLVPEGRALGVWGRPSVLSCCPQPWPSAFAPSWGFGRSRPWGGSPAVLACGGRGGHQPLLSLGRPLARPGGSHSSCTAGG